MSLAMRNIVRVNDGVEGHERSYVSLPEPAISFQFGKVALQVYQPEDEDERGWAIEIGYVHTTDHPFPREVFSNFIPSANVEDLLSAVTEAERWLCGPEYNARRRFPGNTLED